MTAVKKTFMATTSRRASSCVNDATAGSAAACRPAACLGLPRARRRSAGIAVTGSPDFT